MSNRVRPGMIVALKQYAKAEGVSATDILDTLLMKDRTLARHVAEVQKELYGISQANSNTNPTATRRTSDPASAKEATS